MHVRARCPVHLALETHTFLIVNNIDFPAKPLTSELQFTPNSSQCRVVAQELFLTPAIEGGGVLVSCKLAPG